MRSLQPEAASVVISIGDPSSTSMSTKPLITSTGSQSVRFYRLEIDVERAIIEQNDQSSNENAKSVSRILHGPGDDGPVPYDRHVDRVLRNRTGEVELTRQGLVPTYGGHTL